jgi:hypothetical protein
MDDSVFHIITLQSENHAFMLLWGFTKYLGIDLKIYI